MRGPRQKKLLQNDEVVGRKLRITRELTRELTCMRSGFTALIYQVGIC